ncbi:pyridoxal-phosphate dependent enzyme [Aestuariicella sp. G3-2]|uniref:1-aminocyclopropane-1-carboxylate deaminase/D-cysteine desulfhydrase n=1 Tax=Pseudomaricurvus albidus TaxID=2842452 RepID=UPI001C0CBEE8|nr:pyridoxal-phosphate dependent enzyme [Aestuariicella albida]
MISLKQLCSESPIVWARKNPAQLVSYPPLNRLGITLRVKREDCLDHRLSGNKLYKLYGHLQKARETGATRLISFGGYYSNHLHALAYLGQAAGMKTRGLIRGHEPDQLSPTLQDCLSQGMELEFLSRKDYREFQKESSIAVLQEQHPDSLIIPEGGGTLAGTVGCGAIMQAIREELDLSNSTVCVPCGTGTTLAGLLSHSEEGENLLGFSALKLGNQLESYKSGIENSIFSSDYCATWDIIDELHFGGFAKTTPKLFEFMGEFEAETGILLDPIYTAKLLFSANHLAKAGYWAPGHELVVIHTGGLQGRRGYRELTDMDIQA